MDQPQLTVEHETSLLELMSVLVKRKKLIFSITAAAAVISVVITLMLKDVYTGTARIIPPQKEVSSGAAALLSSAALAVGSGFGGSGDLYVGILKSRSVADDVIKKLDLSVKMKAKNADIARLKLAKKVRIQSDKSGIITIMADDRSPQLAADLANAFVEELGRTTVRMNLSKVGIERIFLEKRLSLVKTDLKKAEDELKSFSQSNKLVQVDSQARAAIDGIARLKAELASHEVQLSVLRSYQTDESPEVAALQAGIKKLLEEIGKLSGYDKGSGGIPSIGTFPAVELEYARRMRELKIQEAVYEQLTRQYEVAKLNEAKDTSSVQVLDTAVVPIKKSKPKRSMIVLLATLLAFSVSLLIAFVQEYCEKMSDEDRKTLTEIKKRALAFK